MKIIREKTGFTVIEIMIAAAIFTFIVSALYGTLATGRRSWLTGEALVTAQEQARIAMERVANELRHSNHIHVTVAADNMSVRFDVPADTDGDGFLDFIAGTSSIVFGAEDTANWEIEYQIDANNERLLRRVYNAAGDPQPATIVAQDIDATNCSFQTESGGTGMPQEAVIITLATEVDSVQGWGTSLTPPIQTTLRTRVNLRN